MPRFDIKDPSSIVSYADHLEEFYQPRNDTMVDHQKLYKLDPTVQAGTGHTAITENNPWVIVNFATSIIAMRPPQHKVPLAFGAGDHELNDYRSAELERYLISIWNNVDKQQRLQKHSRFDWELSFYAVLRGWVAGVVAWDDENPQFPFHIKLWDPYHVYPDPDISDLIIRRYRRSAASVIDEYPALDGKIDDDKHKDHDIIEIFHRDKHGILVGNEWAKPMTEHDLGRPQVIMIPVGPMPIRSLAGKYNRTESISRLGDNSYTGYMGQGILFPVVSAQKYQNLLASQIADLVQQFSQPAIIVKTDEGQPVDIETTPGVTIGMKPHEGVDFARPNTFPPDLMAWMQRQASMIERGSFPNVMYGATPHEMSALARSLIHNAGVMRIEPAIDACTFFYEAADALILEQTELYATDRTVNMRGTDYLNKPFRAVKSLWEIKNLIQNDYEVVVDKKPFLPQDRAGNVQMAGMIKQYGIWDNKTINDVLFSEDVHDPQGVEQRLIDEKVRNNPEAIALLAETTAPITVSRNLRLQLERGNITREEFNMAMSMLNVKVGIKIETESKMLGEVAAPVPAPSQILGPRGQPINRDEMLMAQRGQPQQTPPEFLSPQLQGADFPPGIAEE